MGFLLIKPKTQPNHRQKVGFFHPIVTFKFADEPENHSTQQKNVPSLRHSSHQEQRHSKTENLITVCS